MQCIKCLLKPSFEVHNKSAKYCLDCKFLVKKLLNKLYRKGKLQGIDFIVIFSMIGLMVFIVKSQT